MMKTVDTENSAPSKTAPVRPLGRRYTSVTALMKGENISQNVQKEVKELFAKTAVVRRLVELRHRAGLTQAELANRLSRTQSAISKLESGRDEELTVKEIREYVQATDQRIGLMFGKPMNHVEAIKEMAFGIKSRLLALAKLANRDGELEKEIQGFFGEAFFNILSILSECQGAMPNTDGNPLSVRVEVIEQPDSTPIRRRSRRTPLRTEETMAA